MLLRRICDACSLRNRSGFLRVIVWVWTVINFSPQAGCYSMAIYLAEPPGSKIGTMDRSPCAPPTAVVELEIAALFEREAGGIFRYARGLGMDEGTADDAL